MIGQTISHYNVLAKLGEGGMGEVYLAEDTSLGRNVAANIMLTPQGHAKVMDFGLAKKVVAEDGREQDISSALTREGATLGTLSYMSPEQIRGEGVDTRSDIFSRSCDL